MIRLLKKYKFMILVFFIVLYVFGLVAPFIRTKEALTITAPDVSGKAGVSAERVMLLETNESAWSERIRLLNRAKESIILTTFDIRNGESTKDIMSVLQKKAEEGVKVKILVDGISADVRMQSESLFYAISENPNIEIRVYNKLNYLLPWKTQGRMHDKYVIVDEQAYILGGRNTFDYFIGDYKARSKSFDREILVYEDSASLKESSSLAQLFAYFNEIWNASYVTEFKSGMKVSKPKHAKEQETMLHERYENLKSENTLLFQTEDDYYLNQTLKTEGVTLISGETGIYGKHPDVFEQLVELMKQAKKRIVIHTPYIVCDSYMYQGLKEVAATVDDTSIIINSVENGDNFMASSDYLLNKKKVLDIGMSLYEYDGGTSTHGKTVLIDDDLAIIGSYNFDMRSTYMDTELMVAVKGKQFASVVNAAQEKFEEDSRTVISATKYETPAHLKVEEVPWWKRAAFWVTGHVMQLFRCLL